MEKKQLPKLPFELNAIAELFDLERQEHCEHLNKWLDSRYELSATRKELLLELYTKSKADVDYWNEEELKMRMIALLFFIADISVKKKIDVYFERKMSTSIHDHLLSVVVDCMVATPRPFNKPKMPYFFLQEFKKGRESQIDPEAQMLVAMLIAQHKNKDNKPIYGSYIFGRFWYFATLIGTDYCQSRPFDATVQADLFQIVYILRALKDLILNR